MVIDTVELRKLIAQVHETKLKRIAMFRDRESNDENTLHISWANYERKYREGIVDKVERILVLAKAGK